MIQINHITFTYKRKRQLFADFSLTFGPGKVYGLLGRNGSGKSTLLYLMSGLLTPAHGSVMLGGVDVRQRRPSTMADIFIVPEDMDLPAVPLHTYINSNAPFYPNFSHSDLMRHLGQFGLTADIHLGRLSMGQKKKVLMSFAMAANTPVLIMDEPTNGLDIPGKSEFRRFIASNMTDERTIIISTHQVRDIDKILDHVVIIDSGQAIFDASVADIMSTYRFVTTRDPEVIASALYSRPGIEGTSAVLPNDGDSETDIDLESLFEYVTSPTYRKP